MSWNIEVESGKSVRLPTAGKYCDRDIEITASFVYTNNSVRSIATDAFRDCANITGVSCANATSVGLTAFYKSGVTFADLPKVTVVDINAFHSSKLEEINAHRLTTILTGAFQGCPLVKCDFPELIQIGFGAFYNCSMLTTFILRSTAMTTLDDATAFNRTPINSGTGYIYVPAALVDSYKADSNWSTYANQIRAIEDYPEICG